MEKSTENVIVELIDNMVINCKGMTYANRGITCSCFNIGEFLIEHVLYVNKLSCNRYRGFINGKPMFCFNKWQGSSLQVGWYIEDELKDALVENLMEKMRNEIKKHEITLSDLPNGKSQGIFSYLRFWH